VSHLCLRLNVVHRSRSIRRRGLLRPDDPLLDSSLVLAEQIAAERNSAGFCAEPACRPCVPGHRRDAFGAERCGVDVASEQEADAR
jgi:hypothetical protein